MVEKSKKVLDKKDTKVKKISNNKKRVKKEIKTEEPKKEKLILDEEFINKNVNILFLQTDFADALPRFSQSSQSLRDASHPYRNIYLCHFILLFLTFLSGQISPKLQMKLRDDDREFKKYANKS